jgi:hypothetical protein
MDESFKGVRLGERDMCTRIGDLVIGHEQRAPPKELGRAYEGPRAWCLERKCPFSNNMTERNYFGYIEECFAAVREVLHFRVYLYGGRFVWQDQANLVFLRTGSCAPEQTTAVKDQTQGPNLIPSQTYNFENDLLHKRMPACDTR